ncbi:MAG: HAMP domain-containing sensor histidine kinase [Pseudomonadota bacterium]
MQDVTERRAVVSGHGSVARPLALALGLCLALLAMAALLSRQAVEQLRIPIKYANDSAVTVAADLRSLRNSAGNLERMLTPSSRQTFPRSLGVTASVDAEFTVMRDTMARLRDNAVAGLALDRVEQQQATLLSTVDRALSALRAYQALNTELRQQQSTMADAANSAFEASHALSITRLDESTRRELAEMDFEWASIETAISLAADRQTVGLIASDGNRFAASLRRVVKRLSRLPDFEQRRALFDAADLLFTRGRQSPTYFDQQAERLARQGVMVQTHAALATAVVDFSALLDQAAIKNEGLANRALTSAGKRLDQYAVGLLILFLVATLIGLVIMRRYVFHAVVVRLRNLRTTTLRLADGALDEPIVHEGNDEISDLARALTVFRDTAREKAHSEARLAQRTEQLEAVNRELDDFAYVASHDLRAPLHGVDSLAAFVQEDLGDDLPEASARHLSLMRSRIKRLHSLLDALLEFSRLGREHVPTSDVRLRELIRSTVELLRRPGFEISVDAPNDTVSIKVTLFEQLIRNLVDNAIKHHDRQTGSIDVHARIEQQVIVIQVIDDGPGIPVDFQERIFEMFQTLQPRDEVEGSGIGLTFLRKTLNHIGGRIEVRSDPTSGRGTRFIVHWPLEGSVGHGASDVTSSAPMVGMPRPK